MAAPFRAISRVAIRLTGETQAVSTRAPLTAPIPPGAHVRLAADSLRSITGGFDAEQLVLGTGEALAPVGFRLARPPLTSGVDRAPRRLLLARCERGAEVGEPVIVAGTFHPGGQGKGPSLHPWADVPIDRKSTRLNSSHGYISYAVFCLKKKT